MRTFAGLRLRKTTVSQILFAQSREDAKIRHDTEASLISAASLILLKPSSHAHSAKLKGNSKMDETTRILNLFDLMKSDTLDLHTLFEAGGNDPDARGHVIDIVARLVREGFLEERGSDFYALTTKGRAAIGKHEESD